MTIRTTRRAFARMSDSGGRIAGQRKKRAAKVRQHPDGSDLPAATTDKEALVTISPRQSDENPPPRATLFEAAPRIAAPAEGRHWYVDASDYPGYCAACSLPRFNRRHVGRAA